jgi:hypothetical protein
MVVLCLSGVGSQREMDVATSGGRREREERKER